MNLLDVVADFGHAMEEVEERLRSEVESREPILQEASLHLLKAGGKRIRPLFVLLAGQFGEYAEEAAVRVATSLELIHMATLVHDDVIDDADTRRGTLTVKSRWGNRVAMYTGDFIFARALLLLSEQADADLHRTLSRAIEHMCRGEIEQIRDFYRLDQSIRTYLRRIRRKTALLIGVSCHLGAIVSHCEPSVRRTLWVFGQLAGMAFQIVDDVLDFTASAETLGKPVGSDLRQGNITYPTLYALARSPGRDRLHELVRSSASDSEMSEAIDIVKRSGGVEAARDLAKRYLDKSLACLERLPSCPARDTLEALTRFIYSRDR